jgi:hypothetical protein
MDAWRLEAHVLAWLLFWHGEDVLDDPGGDEHTTELREARRHLADAEARLEAFLADDELRSVVGRAAFLAAARERQAAVERARADVERLEADQGEDERRPRVLGEEWWTGLDREEQRDLLHRTIGTIFVRRGRGGPAERVVIFARGEVPAGLPQRGQRGFVPTPLDWPEDPQLASVPRWAWRQSHPRIPPELLATMHEVAIEQGAKPVMPGQSDDAAQASPGEARG